MPLPSVSCSIPFRGACERSIGSPICPVGPRPLPRSLRRGGKGAREPARIDAAEELAVKEILRTNDAVLVSAVEALLEGAYIPYLVLDQNMSVLEGSIGILPRRVLVEDRCLKSARRLLEDAGLARELRPDVG